MIIAGKLQRSRRTREVLDEAYFMLNCNEFLRTFFAVDAFTRFGHHQQTASHHHAIHTSDLSSLHCSSWSSSTAVLLSVGQQPSADLSRLSTALRDTPAELGALTIYRYSFHKDSPRRSTSHSPYRLVRCAIYGNRFPITSSTYSYHVLARGLGRMQLKARARRKDFIHA